MKSGSYFASTAIIQSANEFEINHRFVINCLLRFANSYLMGTDKRVALTPLNVTISILDLLWNLSDKIVLVPMLVKLGCATKSIHWISTDIFKLHINELADPVFSIIYNTSRDKTGLTQLRKDYGFEALMTCKPLVDGKNDDGLKRSFGMTLIALTTSDEQPETNKEFILSISKMLYEWCKNTAKTADLRYDGCHSSELLELLHRAFSNTFVIKNLLDEESNDETKPIQFFAQFLLSIYGALLDKEANELEKRAAIYLLRILLHISNYPEYKKELIAMNRFCVIIEGLAKRPRQDYAKRIWCNLQHEISSGLLKSDQSPMIYISYEKTDRKFCESLVNEFRKKTTIRIWVDYENVDSWEDIWAYVEPIMKTATIIIAILSTAYSQNMEKFQELTYAISNNKVVNEKKGLMAVQAEPSARLDRLWLTNMFQDKTVFHYEDNIEKLAHRICEKIIVSKKTFIPCCTVPAKRLSVKPVT